MSLFTGQVWQDLNANGVQDSGELTLEGITVYLDLNGNQLLDPDEPQSLTDSAGAYSFDNLDDGLYSIRLLSPSNTTLILPQVPTPAISLGGLDADSRGVVLWNTLAGAPEPERTGHDITLNGAVIDSAYYYLASRDYLNPTAPAGIQGQGEIVGFTEFAAALDAQGYTAADLTLQFALASLGADLEGQDWFAEGTRETRFYQGGELTLQLGGQDFLRAAFPTLTALIDYKDPLNLDDDRLSTWSEGFTLEDNSLGSSPEVQAVAQAFLTDAAGQGDLRLVFDSLESAAQVEFNENGREGAVFDAQFGQLGFVEDVGVQEDGYLIVLDSDKTLDSLDFALAPLATTIYEQYTFTYNYGNGDSYTGVVYELAGTYSAGEIIGGFTNDTGNEGFYTIDSVFEVDSATEGEVIVESYIDGNTGLFLAFGEGSTGLGSEFGTVSGGFADSFSPFSEANPIIINPGLGSTISGAVLKDLDGDGLGDLGIGAVQLALFDSLGSGPLALTFTDAAGNYSFFLPSGQDSGNYIVRQTNLVGYEDVSDSDGGDLNEITIVVAPDSFYSGNDFIDQLIPSSLQIQLNLLTDNGGAPGELISANQITAGQTFFVEILAADLRDNAQGIIGLELDLAWDGFLLEVINFDPVSAITSSFTVLQEGTLDNGLGSLTSLVGAAVPEFGEGAAIGVNQLERFALLQFQAEAVSGGPQNLTTTLVSAALADDGAFTPSVETEQPFEVLPPPTGTISGSVLADTDNDGIGDEGIADVTVGLLLNGSIIASQTTDELGNYLFVDFEPGVYVVQQINLTGYSDVSDGDGGDPNEITVTLAPGQINSGNNFIDEQLGEISGQVFEDTDGDDIGDFELANVTVTLLQNGAIVTSAVTDSNGGYVFADLTAGAYTVQQTNLSGYSDVSDSDGGDLNLITVNLAPGQNNSSNNFTDELIPLYEQYSFTYAYPTGDTYTGSVYALEGTYSSGQVVTLSGVPGTYTIGAILATTTDGTLDGVVTLTAYTDNSTGFGTTANVSGSGSGGLGSESGLVIATPFNPLQEADLGFGAITIIDNFGDSADQSIRFTTPLSQFRSNYADSDLVRPNGADTGKYFDILNSGDGILRVSDITVNAPGVSVDLDFSGGDILLNPGASQRVNLTYAPGSAGESLSGALTVFSDAQNNPAIGVILAGSSTFNADINYDGMVNIADLGALNQAKAQEILGNFDPTADINGDGALTTQDIFSWLAEF
ncbi:MAG: SdrD B-like domain-containing protein [Cyanobacteriota bacterium]|jgi:hypothetical protein